MTPAQGDPMRATEVRTELVPSYEVPFTDVPAAGTDQDLPGLADLILDMKNLAEVCSDALGAGLTPARSSPHLRGGSDQAV